MDNLVEYLKNRIIVGMKLEDIVTVFEQMCRIPMEDDMVLFETGTFSFAGKPMFYFSLVRQFPNDEEEYYQIHVEVLYKPARANKMFHTSVWSEEINEDIFEYIRKSQDFAYAKREEYVQVDIFMDET